MAETIEVDKEKSCQPDQGDHNDNAMQQRECHGDELGIKDLEEALSPLFRVVVIAAIAKGPISKRDRSAQWEAGHGFRKMVEGVAGQYDSHRFQSLLRSDEWLRQYGGSRVGVRVGRQF